RCANAYDIEFLTPQHLLVRLVIPEAGKLLPGLFPQFGIELRQCHQIDAVDHRVTRSVTFSKDSITHDSSAITHVIGSLHDSGTNLPRLKKSHGSQSLLNEFNSVLICGEDVLDLRLELLEDLRQGELTARPPSSEL